MSEQSRAVKVLAANTIAFTICFSCWMMNGVLITFLVENRLFDWTKSEMGWLIGIPVLTGAVMRLPVGVLCDKYGGRIVFFLLMILSAVPMYFVGEANSYMGFVLAGLGFGVTGSSFAAGIAYTALWFDKSRQGTALGIFGAGNAGAALTSIGAPIVLARLTATDLEGWRTLPKIYAGILIITAILFWVFTHTRKVNLGTRTGILQRLSPLKNVRVWRFGVYYFFVFGGFVALAQWLIPYYVNAYTMTVATAGLMAGIFSFPSGVIRALGGWWSDKMGARTVMYWVLGISLVCCLLLVFPAMLIQSPGKGVMAVSDGTVQKISENEIVVSGTSYDLKSKNKDEMVGFEDDGNFIFPTSCSWQEPVVGMKVGDKVGKKQLIAKGTTQIYFQANVWIFTGLVFIVGIMMGIGKAAVYKHIPTYFPNDVGVVGGIVGVLGGLGGFFCPIIFGYLLSWSGLWTTCWMFLAGFVVVCLVWMHMVVQRMMKKRAPGLVDQIEDWGDPNNAESAI